MDAKSSEADVNREVLSNRMRGYKPVPVPHSTGPLYNKTVIRTREIVIARALYFPEDNPLPDAAANTTACQEWDKSALLQLTDLFYIG